MSQSTKNSGTRPEPVPTAETRAFWQGAREERLVLHACTNCGGLSAPLSPRCPDCLSDSLTDAPMSGRVCLRGRTVLHIDGLPGRKPPFTVVECTPEEAPNVTLVALDETKATASLGPGAALQLGFAADLNGVFYAVVRKGAA